MAKEITSIEDLSPAPYNPRTISEGELERLGLSMAELGDLSGLVINRRTGHVISGHQRIKHLPTDAQITLEDESDPNTQGTVARGYVEHQGERWAVRVVDWDEAREKVANIAANQHGGHFADALLADLVMAMEPEDQNLAGFSSEELEALTEGMGGDGAAPDDNYSRKVVSPVYTPKGERPDEADLYDETRTLELKAEIESLDAPDEVKGFLKSAAERHTVFQFDQIAEYYAHAPADVQALMEHSALIIIDFNQAIELGYVKITEEMLALAGASKEANYD